VRDSARVEWRRPLRPWQVDHGKASLPDHDVGIDRREAVVEADDGLVHLEIYSPRTRAG
jgi:hypothetical protein